MLLAIKKKAFRTDSLSKVYYSLQKASLISCRKFNHAKTMIIYDKDDKIFGAVNLDKIKKWLLVRTLSNWVGVNFVDRNYQ